MTKAVNLHITEQYTSVNCCRELIIDAVVFSGTIEKVSTK